jgi:hypothetical protein
VLERLESNCVKIKKLKLEKVNPLFYDINKDYKIQVKKGEKDMVLYNGCCLIEKKRKEKKD